MGKGGNITTPESGVPENPMIQEGAKKPENLKKAKAAIDDFHWVGTDEPHATRRKLILAKHPEIKQLFGYCPMTRWVVLAAVAIQTLAAYFTASASWTTYFITAYVIGGTCNHMMMMAMHELSHNLGFKKILHNKIFGLVANLPISVPSSVSFKRYHMEHHRYQGEDGVDTDVPTIAEGRFFNTTLRKFIFVCTQILFYSIRPLIVNPKTPGLWELYNLLACAAYDAFIYRIAGFSGVMYLLLSTLIGAGCHPVAGHFIAEHYVFILGYETYSYYGILNWLTFNVGYHNEHHDFPYVPGTRLPKVRAMAPEFYDNLPRHTSWVKVMFDYVTDPAISAFSRIKRKNLSNDDRIKLKSE